MATPAGYSGATLVQQIQLRTNEFTALTGAQIIQLANAGVEQVEGEIGGIRLYDTIATNAGDQIFTLGEDVQDVYSMSFSTGPLVPAPSTAIVYPMTQMEPERFMQFAAGFPGVGAGPPTTWMAFQDEDNVMSIQVYPPAMLGQLNIYYRGRPQLWADATVNSSTNLDTLAQEAVVLWTCCRVLEGVQRGDESKDIFQPQFDNQIEKIRVSMARRSVPKQSVVNDVRGVGWPGSVPWWLGG